MGVHRVLVSLPDFKSGVACQKRAGWVRFPHAPAILLFDVMSSEFEYAPPNRYSTADS